MTRLSFLTTLILTFTTITLSAQEPLSLRARVIDSSNGEGVVGAVAVLKPMNGETPQYTTSSLDGALNISPLTQGRYSLELIFMGYDTLRQEVTVASSSVDLGEVAIAQNSQNIDDVVVEVNALRTSLKGDTLIYNADAFKVNRDATTDNLLAKMPGITVGDDGAIEAQGEEVKKIYIDGKEFFGEDARIALKNIPADMIASIELYNKLSDESALSGAADGEEEKSINIVTKSGVFGKKFGKIATAYTLDNRYSANANMTYLGETQRLTLIAMSNNVNQQNFGSEDLLEAMGGDSGSDSSLDNFMVGFQPGLSDVHAIGLNYSGSFAERFKVDASYFFNYTDNYNERGTEKSYLPDEDGEYRFDDIETIYATINLNHRIRIKLDYEINERHTIIMRPSFSYQTNDNSTYSINNRYNIGDESNLTKYIINDRVWYREGYTLSNSILYRAKFSDRGNSLTLNAGYSRSTNGYLSDRYTINEDMTLTEDDIDEDSVNPTLSSQLRDSYSVTTQISAAATYTEYITEHARVNIQYRYNNKLSDAELYVWGNEEVAELGYNYDRVEDFYSDNSSIYQSSYSTHRVGPGFNYSRDKLSINSTLHYEYAELNRSQTLPEVIDNEGYTFGSPLYYLMMRLPINPSNSLRAWFRSKTDNPSISQLQSVINYSNTQRVRTGNTELTPSYQHTMYLSYTRTNNEDGRTFMAMSSAMVEQDYIANYTFMNSDDDYLLTINSGEVVSLESGSEFIQPKNMDGRWRLRGMISYGTPLSFISSNLNISLNAQYSQYPSMLATPSTPEGFFNMRGEMGYWASVSVGSNISENVDFTLSYNGRYNIISYNIEEQVTDFSTNDSEYLTQTAKAIFKFELPLGLTLSGDGTFTQYIGMGDLDFNKHYLFANLYLGKRLFKREQAEISIGVNDMLDNKETFLRQSYDTNTQNVTNRFIGRFYSMQFVYNFRPIN